MTRRRQAGSPADPLPGIPLRVPGLPWSRHPSARDGGAGQGARQRPTYAAGGSSGPGIARRRRFDWRADRDGVAHAHGPRWTSFTLCGLPAIRAMWPERTRCRTCLAVISAVEWL